MKVRAWLVIVTLIWASLLPGAQKTAPESANTVDLPLGAAMVGDVKGEVSIRAADGSALPSTRGEKLQPGTVIQTFKKSSIILDLSDGSQVLVKANSRVTLTDPLDSAMQYLQLLIGKIVVKVQKRLENAPSFRMGTPTAVITVRGTRFGVEVNKKQRTFVEVYEGVVEVLGMPPHIGSSRPVMLRPGFATEAWERGTRNPWRFEGRDDAEHDSRSGAWGERSGRDRDREGSENSTKPSGERSGSESDHHD